VVNRQVIVPVILAFLIGVVATLFVVSALFSATVKIGSVAAIKTVGVAVYWDPALTQSVTSVSWGIVEPGEVKNVSCYIKNTSNVPIILTLTTNNYTPANVEQYVSLTWNYDEQWIPVGTYVPITFSLHVDQATTGITAFSFDITIIGSG
jgi:hypothetical protein